MEYMDSELVIMEVEKYPCLYNTRCETYKNRNMKLEAWTSVSRSIVGDKWEQMSNEERNAIGKEIQQRWRTLRDSFTRAMRSLEGRSGSGAKKMKPYVYYRQMTFLIPTLQSRPTSGNMDGEAGPSSTEPAVLLEEPERLPEEAERNDKEPTHPARKRNKKGETFERELLKVLHKSANEAHVNDPDKMFLLSLLPSLKQVKPSQKLEVQIKIMELLNTYTCFPEPSPLVQAVSPNYHAAPSRPIHTIIPRELPSFSQSAVHSQSPSIDSDDSLMSLLEL